MAEGSNANVGLNVNVENLRVVKQAEEYRAHVYCLMNCLLRLCSLFPTDCLLTHLIVKILTIRPFKYPIYTMRTCSVCALVLIVFWRWWRIP